MTRIVSLPCNYQRTVFTRVILLEIVHRSIPLWNLSARYISPAHHDVVGEFSPGIWLNFDRSRNRNTGYSRRDGYRGNYCNLINAYVVITEMERLNILCDYRLSCHCRIVIATWHVPFRETSINISRPSDRRVNVLDQPRNRNAFRAFGDLFTRPRNYGTSRVHYHLQTGRLGVDYGLASVSKEPAYRRYFIKN